MNKFLKKFGRCQTNSNSKRSLGGFTIIEVLIVLSIAGLILTIVFIAVPQLQRNARDNQRQNVASRIKSEIETYANNNQGTYPFMSTGCTNDPAADSGKICDFVARYINGKVNIKDPLSGSDVMANPPSATNNGKPQAYAAAVNTTDLNGITAGQFFIVYGAKCQGQGVGASGSAATTTKTYAVIIGLERAGTSFCLDNG